jgi:hypothetical protein
MTDGKGRLAKAVERGVATIGIVTAATTAAGSVAPTPQTAAMPARSDDQTHLRVEAPGATTKRLARWEDVRSKARQAEARDLGFDLREPDVVDRRRRERRTRGNDRR